MSPAPRTATRPAVATAVEDLLGAWDETQNLMTRMPAIIEEEFAIPSHRLHVMGAVERGASRIQDIARLSLTSVSAASRTVDGLVRDGWLDRRPDPEDRRATQVTMTDVGVAEFDRVRAWARGMVAGIVEDLGIDRVQRMAADLRAFTAHVAAQVDQRDG